jgi:hypothetical protein
MQWLSTIDQTENPTISGLVRIAQVVYDRAKFILLIGEKSRIKSSEMQLYPSPMLEQLSCSAEHLIRALLVLQSWMGTNVSENGRTQLMNVNKASDGYAECLQMNEALLCTAALLDLAESVIL